MSIALLLLVAQASADPGLHPPPSLPPRWAYDAVWMGGSWEASSQGTASDVGFLWDGPIQFDLALRNVSDGPTWIGTGLNQRVRISRDESGRTVFDELSLQARFVGLTIRPAMGDLFDVSILGGRWDQNVFGLSRPWTHLQVFVPAHLVGVGFSDTDADTDTAIRYYAAIGAGIGADWIVRLGGPVGLRLRAEGAADTMHRLRREERDQVRHEVWGRAESDLVLIDAEMPFTFGAWAEVRTQWEPRDTPDGVDRQVLAGGVRFGLRLFRGNGLFGEGDGTWSDPGNQAATRVTEKQHGRINDRNTRRLDSEEEFVEPVEVVPPATPEEHEANNGANEP